jgi:hypothetical protein
MDTCEVERQLPGQAAPTLWRFPVCRLCRREAGRKGGYAKGIARRRRRHDEGRTTVDKEKERYDERCGDLARCFLAEMPGPPGRPITEVHVDFVAWRIQLAADDAIAEIRETRAGKCACGHDGKLTSADCPRHGEQALAPAPLRGPLGDNANLHIVARDRRRGSVLVGGLGAVGVGERWFDEEPRHAGYPGYDNAPERAR